MNTLRYLTDPVLCPIYLPGVLTGLAVALMCAVLSPLAVLKRMSFVGQGISHAGFGGVGIVAMLVALYPGGAVGAFAMHPLGQFAIVLSFCLGSALLIAELTESRGSGQADTAIGIVLVGSMTLGALLIQLAYRFGSPRLRAWDSLLFGDIFSVGWGDAALAAGAVVMITLAVWWLRRPLLFWAFDEPAAPAFGVPPHAMRRVFVVLLALAIVTAMKLAGVVLATALLVLPGAAALRLSDRLARVVALSALVALLGVVLGLMMSFELNLPPGGCIVAALVTLYFVARALGGLRRAAPVAAVRP